MKTIICLFLLLLIFGAGNQAKRPKPHAIRALSTLPPGEAINRSLSCTFSNSVSRASASSNLKLRRW